MDKYVYFCGSVLHTTVTSSAAVVDRWISKTLQIHGGARFSNPVVVGIDVEWRPYYRPEDRNPLATLQICVGNRCLIFQLLHADSFPESLGWFLAFPGFAFAGVGVGDDAHKMFDELGLRVGKTLDVANLAAVVFGIEDYRKWGLKRLAKEVLGKAMEKPKHVTLSRWDAEELSVEQIEYAAIDAHVSWELGKSLLDRLNELRRMRRVPFPIHHPPVHHSSCNGTTAAVHPPLHSCYLQPLPVLAVVYPVLLH